MTNQRIERRSIIPNVSQLDISTSSSACKPGTCLWVEVGNPSDFRSLVLNVGFGTWESLVLVHFSTHGRSLLCS